jgi:hypothetical protein
VENTLYFGNFTGSGSSNELTLLGDDIMSWWINQMMPLLVQQYILREVYVVDMSSDTAPTATVTPGSETTGSVTSPSMPNNVALCVSFRTAGRGRSSRGRNYISGFGEGAVEGNRIASSVANDIKAVYQSLLDPAIFVIDWTWVVYSRYENKQPRSVASTPAVEAVVLTDTIVDSQRRRLPGRGR